MPFPFLDNQGYRYYLPAYMCFVIKNPGQTVGDMLIYSLVPYFENQRWGSDLNFF